MNPSENRGTASATEKSVDTETANLHDVELDARDLSCPMPLLKAKMALNQMSDGEVLLVKSSDPGSLRDIPAFANLVGHAIEVKELDKEYHFLITKNRATKPLTS